MPTYLFFIKSENLADVDNPLEADPEDDRWWSCSRTTQAGDTALVYVVGVGIKYEINVVSDAEPHDEWRYICAVEFGRKIEPPIEFQEICDIVTKAEWAPPHLNFRGYRSLLIPDKVAERIRGLRLSREIRTKKDVSKNRSKKPNGDKQEGKKPKKKSGKKSFACYVGVRIDVMAGSKDDALKAVVAKIKALDPHADVHDVVSPAPKDKTI